MTKKLEIADAGERAKTFNFLKEPAVLEAVDGPNAQRPRIIHKVDMFKQRLDRKPGQEPVLVSRLLVIGPDKYGYYNLDEDTALEYNEKGGFLSFSSGGVRYKIRAVEESDQVPTQALSDESAPEEEGKSS